MADRFDLTSTGYSAESCWQLFPFVGNKSNGQLVSHKKQIREPFYHFFLNQDEKDATDVLFRTQKFTGNQMQDIKSSFEKEGGFPSWILMMATFLMGTIMVMMPSSNAQMLELNRKEPI